MDKKEEERLIRSFLEERNRQLAYSGCGMPTLAVIVFLVLLLTGCKTTQYIPVETVKTEYISKTDTFIQKDSIYTRDSVLIESKNDTVFVNKWHYAYKDKIVEKILTDTIIKVDSVRVPYPVEKQLTKWQKIKMNTGLVTFIIFVLVIISFIVGVILRKKF